MCQQAELATPSRGPVPSPEGAGGLCAFSVRGWTGSQPEKSVADPCGHGRRTWCRETNGQSKESNKTSLCFLPGAWIAEERKNRPALKQQCALCALPFLLPFLSERELYVHVLAVNPVLNVGDAASTLRGLRSPNPAMSFQRTGVALLLADMRTPGSEATSEKNVKSDEHASPAEWASSCGQLVAREKKQACVE